MKKIILLAFVCLFASVADMHAQNTIKFGSVDAMSIIHAMPEYASAQKKLEAKLKEFDAEIQRMQNELMEKVKAYDKQKATLSQKEQEEREEQLQLENNRIQLTYTHSQEELEKMQEEELKVLYEKIKTAVAAVGQKNGLIQIFDTSSGSNVLYNNPAYVTDVTSLVKKELGIK